MSINEPINSSKPLYLLAESKMLEDIQIMDIETLEWIKVESNFKAAQISESNIRFDNIELISFFDFFPKAEWFFRKDHVNTLHGMSHISRVIINTALICKIEGIEDMYPYLMSAQIHDLRRENDKADLGHGKRSWEWFKNNLALFPSRHEECFLEFENKLELAIVNHETDYADIQALNSNHRYILDILKAADALDRYRMPKKKWFPDPKYIFLKSAHQLIDICRDFTILSEDKILKGNSIKDSIKDTANHIFNYE